MPELVTLRGWVATDPRHHLTDQGIPITSFRLAAPERRYRKETESWEDAPTSWYTVTAFRKLASNTAVCVKKGQRIIVYGKLRIREWSSGDRAGVNAEVDAESLGHDLGWGTAAFDKGYGRKAEQRLPNEMDDPMAVHSPPAQENHDMSQEAPVPGLSGDHRTVGHDDVSPF